LYLQEFGYDIDKALKAGHAAKALTDEQIGVMFELETLSDVLEDAYSHVITNRGNV
jgi:hypothetical protein